MILVINKPKNITSNKLIQLIKKNTNIKKIGHGGTLDPSATGVLIIGINESTKLLNSHLCDQKEYIATIKFGIQTTSYDLEGDILKEEEMTVDINEVKTILDNFKVEYLQTPPIFSAIKVNGKSAYKYARNNQDIKLEPRKVELRDYSIINFDSQNNILKIKILVSKGFYVRSLANDLGKMLNGCATLIDLVRTKSGNYSIESSIDYQEAIKIINQKII